METLRLFPPVPAIARQINEDVRLGNYLNLNKLQSSRLQGVLKTSRRFQSQSQSSRGHRKYAGRLKDVLQTSMLVFLLS